MIDPLLERFIDITGIDRIYSGNVELYEQVKSQLNEKLEIGNDLLSSKIFVDSSGVQRKYAFCILAKESDIWLADSLGNLHNFLTLEQQIKQLREEFQLKSKNYNDLQIELVQYKKVIDEIKRRYEECKTNSNMISAKDNWKEYTYQIKLEKELKSILPKLEVKE